MSRRLSRCTTADVVDVSTDDTLIVKLDGIGDGSTNVMDLTNQPLRIRVLLAEIPDKYRVSNLKPSHSGMVVMLLLLRLLMLSDSLGQVGSHDVKQ